MSVDIYDENGVGGGASGVSGGLLHPYSPKGLLPPSSQPNHLKVIGFVPHPTYGYSANDLASSLIHFCCAFEFFVNYSEASLEGC